MRSLRGRLGIALAATAFVSVAMSAIVAVQLLRANAELSARGELERAAQALARNPDIIGNEDVSARVLTTLLRVNQISVALVAPGPLIRGSGAGVSVAQTLDVETLFGGRTMRGNVRVAGKDYAYYGVPALFNGTAGGVILTRPVEIARHRAGSLIVRVLLAAIAALLGALAISAWLADRMTRPVREMSAAAQRIARGDLTQQVPVGSDDEIGELARTFNDMSLALTEAQRREREFVASVSHELRTPITAIRGYAEAIQDGAVHGEEGRAEAIDIIRSEADRLERMVQDVMDLARLGSREFHLEMSDVDLATVVTATVAAHQLDADEAEVTLATSAVRALLVHTDPDRVHQIITNLLQNAVRVTPSGGRVDVRVEPRGADAVIEIADTGPGIAPEDLPHVFERTYLWRASKGRVPVGTGLGLAIVRELVVALGGRIEVRSVLGEGTTFTIAFGDHA